jgi:NAD(P)-dependent dehydrogenase (short-subunit alcohol dehydrogenase family)
LLVEGRSVATSGEMGRVDVTVSDRETGARYVEGGYEFSRHEVEPTNSSAASAKSGASESPSTILVTGASGGLGRAVLARLGADGLGVSRTARPDMLHVPDLEQIGTAVGERRIDAIVHCAWPAPDNQQLTALGHIYGAVDYNVATPLRQVLALAQVLRERGNENALLVLVGSTAARPGRHLYRTPLYTLSKSLIPTLTQILAVELADSTRRCVAVTFDVIEAGMNKRLTPAIRAMHADRAPSGQLPGADDAAAQIEWVLANRSFMASGATIDLSGAAIP